MNQRPAIEVHNLSIGYPDREVARGISFSIGRGEVVALLGRNGCGKSTLLQTVTGTLPSLGGRVLINGRELNEISRRQMAREVSVVVTDNARDSYLSVLETVELGRHPYTGFLGSMSAADHRIVDEAIASVGCRHLSGRNVGTLSDGERQKVSIARALAQDTPVMLLDEPFSFIDVAARLELLALLKEIARKGSRSIIFSTHDVAQAFRYADRLLCFTTDGRVVCGSASEMVAGNIPEHLFDTASVVFDPALMDYRLKTPPSDPTL